MALLGQFFRRLVVDFFNLASLIDDPFDHLTHQIRRAG
jgi:hypothetical protein